MLLWSRHLAAIWRTILENKEYNTYKSIIFKLDKIIYLHFS